MGIKDDWQVDFNNKFINHIDGTINYDTNTGTAPASGDYIRGGTSLAVGKVIAGDDLGGTNATGTLTLTNVTGRFENNEAITVLDSLGFDTIANGGFAVGDVLDEQGAGTGELTVYAIEYNNADDGIGIAYGVHANDSFINNDVLDINGGVTDVGAATGAEGTAATFTGALFNGVLTAPSRNIIVNYDEDAVVTALAIPRFAQVQNANFAPTVSGLVQQVTGATTGGSLALSDAERSQWLLYDAETVVFAEDFTLTGGTSGATATIALVIDNGTEGALFLKQISGTFEDNETITDNQATPGSATSNGTVGADLVPYDTEGTGPFVVGNTLTNTTDGSTTGVIRGLQDDGTTGLLVVSGMTSTSWADDDALTEASVTGIINGSVTRSQWLLFDAETVAFTEGLLLTGGTSTATGMIVSTVTDGADGAVELLAIVGTFQDNETITDSGTGSATSNGTTGEVYFAYDGEDTGPFTVGNTLTNTADGSTTGLIRGLQDDGTVGFMVVEEVGSTKWGNNDTLTDGAVSALINGGVRQKIGDWTDNDRIYVSNTVYYDNVQSGQSFKLNDLVEGEGTDGAGAGSNGAQGKIISIDTAAQTIVLLNLVSGPFVDNEQLHVNSVWIALADTATDLDTASFTRYHADGNDTGPGLIKTEQLVAQGGLYATQLNPTRDANQFYTFLQDTFDELAELDDEVPMTAQVKLQQYTLINDWKIPDLSYRFLHSGSVQDSNLNNIWTNYQTLGSVGGIDDVSYGNNTPQPQIYIEQNGSVLSSFWLEAHIDVIVKVKSNSDNQLTATGAGAEINSGTVNVFVRRFSDTYDNFPTTTIAGVAPIPLATAGDLNNATGTHSFTFDGGVGGEVLLVGEEIVATAGVADADKRGVITAYTTADDITGTIAYILTGGTQFLNNDVVTGQVTGYNKTSDATATEVVSGYGTDIVVSTVQQTITHAGTTGTFDEGEQVSQAVSGALGILMIDSGTVLTLGNVSGVFDNSNIVTGANSGATATSTGTPANVTTLLRDIGDGNGDQAYNAVVYMDRTNASPRTLADMYEWIKYRTRRQEETGEPAYSLLGGKGDGSDGPIAVQGRIYSTLDDVYPLVKASPFGTFAGGTFFGARGVFIQDMASADIRNYQLIDAAGTLRFPPNQQALIVQGLATGDRVAVFRRPNSTPGSGINTAEYSMSGNQSSGAGTVVVGTVISTDTPSSGVLRIYNNLTLVYDSYAYASFATSTFTLTGTLSQQYDDGATPIGDVYVPLLQEQSAGASVSANIIYGSDIPLLARVRQKGILPFEVEGTFTSTGATITAIRTTDTIVD